MKFTIDMTSLENDETYKTLMYNFARAKLALVNYFNEKCDLSFVPEEEKPGVE